MHIEEQYITPKAQLLIEQKPFASTAYHEIVESVNSMVSVINNLGKNCNGVVPLKEPCYRKLEDEFGWYRKKPLDVLAQKGGPIDVYKLFSDGTCSFRVGVEFETGNISSAHRAMNKLSLGLHNGELDLAVLMMPMHKLSYYLTDRVSNYEELKPYFPLVSEIPFIMIGFDVEEYSVKVECLAKGKDGMSERSIRKWSQKGKVGK